MINIICNRAMISFSELLSHKASVERLRGGIHHASDTFRRS